MRTTRWRAHTLVEVMIAMALGLLILLAAMSLYRVQRAAYSAAVDAARLRDAAQAALALISQQIQMAGFVPLDAYDARAVPGLFGCAAGRPVGADGQAACDPLASRSDGLVVRYVGDGVSTWPTASGQPTDCLGQGVGAADTQPLIVNRFYARVSASTGEPELYCEGSGRPGIAQPLVEGVERLSLRYRLYGAARWADASALSVDDWANVAAVSVCVQVRGRRTGRPARYVDCEGRVASAPDTRARLAWRRYVAVRTEPAHDARHGRGGCGATADVPGAPDAVRRAATARAADARFAGRRAAGRTCRNGFAHRDVVRLVRDREDGGPAYDERREPIHCISCGGCRARSMRDRAGERSGATPVGGRRYDVDARAGRLARTGRVRRHRCVQAVRRMAGRGAGAELLDRSMEAAGAPRRARLPRNRARRGRIERYGRVAAIAGCARRRARRAPVASGRGTAGIGNGRHERCHVRGAIRPREASP
ncbi:prepilin-type cleavage/methylation-like domain protein [Burkholderia pseudomallei A79D]|nr:prepilin-type cleavage/methylation-like domain protein [Burkholderia pseudomallei A79D]